MVTTSSARATPAPKTARRLAASSRDFVFMVLSFPQSGSRQWVAGNLGRIDDEQMTSPRHGGDGCGKQGGWMGRKGGSGERRPSASVGRRTASPARLRTAAPDRGIRPWPRGRFGDSGLKFG